MLAFPTSAASVTGWLDEVNLAKYVSNFERAGITSVNDLQGLTEERLQLAGVTLPGHRKRLLQAAKELIIEKGALSPVVVSMALQAFSALPF